MSLPSEAFSHDTARSYPLPTGFDIWVELINRTLLDVDFCECSQGYTCRKGYISVFKEIKIKYEG